MKELSTEFILTSKSEYDGNGNKITDKAKFDQAKSSSEQRALKNLDKHGGMESIPSRDLQNIIGVFVGIKKVAYIGNHAFTLIPSLQHDIQQLALTTDSREDLYIEGHINRVVAKTPELAKQALDIISQQGELLNKRNIFKKLADLFMGSNRWDSPELIKLDQELGRLLGYPETSFIAFNSVSNRYKGPEDNPFVGGYLHSKSHYREEIAAYDAPLEQATKELIPQTYAVMDRPRQRRS